MQDTYADLLKRINAMMREEFPHVDSWALIVDEKGRVGPIDVAGFDIDRVIWQYVITRGWVTPETKENVA